MKKKKLKNTRVRQSVFYDFFFFFFFLRSNLNKWRGIRVVLQTFCKQTKYAKKQYK